MKKKSLIFGLIIFASCYLPDTPDIVTEDSILSNTNTELANHYIDSFLLSDKCKLMMQNRKHLRLDFLGPIGDYVKKHDFAIANESGCELYLLDTTLYMGRVYDEKWDGGYWPLFDSNGVDVGFAALDVTSADGGDPEIIGREFSINIDCKKSNYVSNCDKVMDLYRFHSVWSVIKYN